jgi:adenylate kinase
MADQVVDQLKATIEKLENKVRDLEDQLRNGTARSGGGEGQGMRMILIGPPGAGVFDRLAFRDWI